MGASRTRVTRCSRNEQRSSSRKIKAVAEKRRTLPARRARLQEDYVFRWASSRKVEAAGKILRAVRRQEHADHLLMDMRARTGTTRALVHVADGWVRSQLVRQVSRDASFVAIAKAPAEKISAAGPRVADGREIPLLSGFEIGVQSRLQMPGDSERHAARSVWPLSRRDGRIFHVLGHRTEGQPRRHCVAVLESDGLHTGGTAGHSRAAADVPRRSSWRRTI